MSSQLGNCIKNLSPIPNFSIQGRSKFFGLYRPSLQSSSITKGAIIFFPKADHIALHFCNELSGSFKTAAILGKNEDSIYIFITCDSLEEFDQKTNGIPSNIYVYADIKGQVAEMFGIRPLMAVIDVKDIFSSGNQKKSYEKQTLTGTFFITNNKIVKNPGYQPKLQQASITILKTGFEFFDKIQYDINLATTKGSFGEDMTEKELQTIQKQAWDAYQEEYNQMLQDQGQKTFKSTKPPQKKEIPKEDKKEDQKKQENTKGVKKVIETKNSEKVTLKSDSPKEKKPSLLKKKEKKVKKEKPKKKDEDLEPKKPLRSKL